MADSSYYKNLYNQKKKEAKSYNENLQDLRKIQERLKEDFGDEIRNVNYEIDALKEDLNKAIRHNNQFGTNVNQLEDQKEVRTTLDGNLRTAISELDEEINRIIQIKGQAEQERDRYQQEYNNKKEKERQERLEKLFGKG